MFRLSWKRIFENLYNLQSSFKIWRVNLAPEYSKTKGNSRLMPIRERWEFELVKPSDLKCLVGHMRLSAKNVGLEQDVGKLIVLPWIVDVLVTKRAPDSKQPIDPDEVARLLLALSHSALSRSFSEILASSRKSPKAVVRSANQQQAVLVIDNKRIAAAISGDRFRHDLSDVTSARRMFAFRRSTTI